MSSAIEFKPLANDKRSARQLAERYHAEFIELKGFHVDKELVKSIDVGLMFRYNFVPLSEDADGLVVAMPDPSDLAAIDDVSAMLKRRLIIRVAELSEIQDLLK